MSLGLQKQTQAIVIVIGGATAGRHHPPDLETRRAVMSNRYATLRAQGPAKPGTYRLYVFAAGHAARCVVVVG